VSGVTTLANTSVGTLGVTGVTTLANTSVATLGVTGVTTLANTSVGNLGVTGVTTLANTSVGGTFSASTNISTPYVTVTGAGTSGGIVLTGDGQPSAQCQLSLIGNYMFGISFNNTTSNMLPGQGITRFSVNQNGTVSCGPINSTGVTIDSSVSGGGVALTVAGYDLQYRTPGGGNMFYPSAAQGTYFYPSTQINACATFQRDILVDDEGNELLFDDDTLIY
jgi:hypothetical protein